MMTLRASKVRAKLVFMQGELACARSLSSDCVRRSLQRTALGDLLEDTASGVCGKEVKGKNRGGLSPCMRLRAPA
jgi:hypothetical protein